MGKMSRACTATFTWKTIEIHCSSNFTHNSICVCWPCWCNESQEISVWVTGASQFPGHQLVGWIIPYLPPIYPQFSMHGERLHSESKPETEPSHSFRLFRKHLPRYALQTPKDAIARPQNDRMWQQGCHKKQNCDHLSSGTRTFLLKYPLVI